MLENYRSAAVFVTCASGLLARVSTTQYDKPARLPRNPQLGASLYTFLSLSYHQLRLDNSFPAN